MLDINQCKNKLTVQKKKKKKTRESQISIDSLFAAYYKIFFTPTIYKFCESVYLLFYFIRSETTVMYNVMSKRYPPIGIKEMYILIFARILKN